MIHLYDLKTMAYTACYKLPHTVKTSPDRSEVTCPRCLHPKDAEGAVVTVGNLILMPNGKQAMVTGIIVLPAPEVVVIYGGKQVPIPAGEVLLLDGQ